MTRVTVSSVVSQARVNVLIVVVVLIEVIAKSAGVLIRVARS